MLPGLFVIAGTRIVPICVCYPTPTSLLALFTSLQALDLRVQSQCVLSFIASLTFETSRQRSADSYCMGSMSAPASEAPGTPGVVVAGGVGLGLIVLSVPDLVQLRVLLNDSVQHFALGKITQ